MWGYGSTRGVVAALVATLGCATVNAWSGELRLANGALIPGELKRIDAGHLVWTADLIGDIRVPKSAVTAFHTTTELALQTAPDAAPLARCAVGASGAEAALRCAGGEPLSSPLATLREAPPAHASSGKITASLDLERGDTAAEDQLDVDARAVRRRGQRRHTFEGSVDYEQNPSRTTEDEAELLYQGDYLLRDGWFVYGMTEYRRDREASIQETLLVGAGAGHEFSPVDGVQLRLQAGLNEVKFNLEERGKELAEAGTIRWRASWETPWREIEFAHEGDYGVVLEEPDIYLVETKTSLSLPIARGLTGELRLDYDRYGISPEGGGRTELEWVFGLGYRW